MASVYRKKRKVTNPRTGQVEVRKSKKWWIKYRDKNGIIRRQPGYTDKSASQELALAMERDAELGVAGTRQRQHAESKRPLIDHVGEFRAALAAKGNSPKHVNNVIARVTRIINGCAFSRIGDVVPSKVQQFVGDLKQQGLGAQTCNFYLQAMQQFFNWLRMDGRIAGDRLAELRMFKVEKDRRRGRRALRSDEFCRLLDAAATGGKVEGLSGSDRVLLYMLAACTGLRRGELASLTCDSFDLAGTPPTVTVAAAYAKNGREDAIPLHPQVVDVLRPRLQQLRRGDHVLPLRTEKHIRNTARMMKADLGAARHAWIEEAGSEQERKEREGSDFLAYCNHNGRFADFHANRHTFITNLHLGGVDLRTAQRLARHSNVQLTASVYTHVPMAERAEAVSKLPVPARVSDARMVPSEVPETVPNGAQNGAVHLSRVGPQLSSNDRDGERRDDRDDDAVGGGKSFQSRVMCARGQPVSAADNGSLSERKSLVDDAGTTVTGGIAQHQRNTCVEAEN